MTGLAQLPQRLHEADVISAATRDALLPLAQSQTAEAFFEQVTQSAEPGLTPFQIKQLRKLREFTTEEIQRVLCLGNYVLSQKLGQGGMGTVYKGRRRGSQDLVALKRIKAETPNLRRRIKNEYKVMVRVQNELAQLRYPPVVRAVELFQQGKSEVLVMEYQNAGDLEHLIRNKSTLDWKKVCRWAIQLLSGLNIAHKQGIIHRDIKPSNILLHRTAERTVVRLGDWGLAKLYAQEIEASMNQTQMGQLIGSIQYMPPEQWSCKPVVPASDLYTLGGTLWFALMGRPPFSRGREDTTHSLCMAHASAPRPSLRLAGRNDVPPGLDTLLQRMMAFRPEDRGTAEELISRFSMLLQGGSVATAPLPANSGQALGPGHAPLSMKPSPAAATPRRPLAPTPPAPKLPSPSYRQDREAELPSTPTIAPSPPQPTRKASPARAPATGPKPLSPQEIRRLEARNVPLGVALGRWFRVWRQWLLASTEAKDRGLRDQLSEAIYDLGQASLAWMESLRQPFRFWYRWLLLIGLLAGLVGILYGFWSL